MEVRVARTRGDVLQCQYLIAEVYNREYEVVFSDDSYDLDAKIEPWPHRYLMGHVGGELIACAGLYLHDTYVERFGNVSNAEIDRLIHEAGAAPRFTAERKREITKVSVRKSARGRGYARFFLGCAHSRDFLQIDTVAGEPVVLVCCARKSIWDNMWGGARIHTRTIKEFPFYKVHELYRSPTDPMDSRLVIPELDVPARWYDRRLPGEYEVER
jgi:hypothetical protein